MSEIFDLKAKDITNLKLKLDGKLPINRDELLALVNSWGRDDWFYTLDKNGDEIEIEKFNPKQKFDLSKLDVSKITNFDSLFERSNFNGDISLWDVSNATSMAGMFYKAKKFNSPLDKWNISKVKDMNYMFYGTESFNKPLNSWDLSNIESCFNILNNAQAFEKRFNNSKKLPIGTNEVKEWLIDNRDRMIAIDIEKNKANYLDNFLSNLNNKDIIIN